MRVCWFSYLVVVLMTKSLVCYRVLLKSSRDTPGLVLVLVIYDVGCMVNFIGRIVPGRQTGELFWVSRDWLIRLIDETFWNVTSHEWVLLRNSNGKYTVFRNNVIRRSPSMMNLHVARGIRTVKWLISWAIVGTTLTYRYMAHRRWKYS